MSHPRNPCQIKRPTLSLYLSPGAPLHLSSRFLSVQFVHLLHGCFVLSVSSTSGPSSPPLSKLDRLPGGRQNLLAQPSNAGANEKGSAGRHSTSSTTALFYFPTSIPVYLPFWARAAHAQKARRGSEVSVETATAHCPLAFFSFFFFFLRLSDVSFSSENTLFCVVLARLHLHRCIELVPLSAACSPASCC